MGPIELTAYDFETLVHRLSDGFRGDRQKIIFLLGSGVSAPTAAKNDGVPLAAGIVDLIRSSLDGNAVKRLDNALLSSANPYQTAFEQLIGLQGAEAANDIVKRAVWNARKAAPSIDAANPYVATHQATDQLCEQFETNFHEWNLNPGVSALGRIMAHPPAFLSETILTTNFDPLVKASIRLAGGQCLRTVLHRDGDLDQSSGDGSRLIHLHGYWFGSDTLHIPRQLLQDRPRLKASLRNLIQNCLLVVVGYSGWDDIVLESLKDIVVDDKSHSEIVWTTFGSANSVLSNVAEKLAPGVDRGRVNFYENIDSNALFPELAKRWNLDVGSREVLPKITEHKPIKASTYKAALKSEKTPTKDAVEFNADTPPVTDFFVGRKDEITTLKDNNYRCAFITGIGGQGKSSLAASYFEDQSVKKEYNLSAWLDCREQSERFENQLVMMISCLSNDFISRRELSGLSVDVLTNNLIDILNNRSMLIVFDNIDHYVDLENFRLSGAPLLFFNTFLARDSNLRVIFTCRPEISQGSEGSISIRLQGIDIESTKSLFKKREAYASEESIVRAHIQTNGHVFWLTLLAAQIAQRHPHVTLDEILISENITASGLPTATLQSIWDSLQEREQIVLQGLAEVFRPISKSELSDVLRSKLNFHKLSRALSSLKNLNLIVQKKHLSGSDLIELHPVVRSFIRTTFAKDKRNFFINAWLAIYDTFISMATPIFEFGNVQSNIDRWTESAELNIEVGRFDIAIDKLDQVSDLYSRSDSPFEFVRVVKLLLDSGEWAELAKIAKFDNVFNQYFEMLSNLDREDACLEAIENYRATVKVKDARYINYCDLMCYFHWVNGRYLPAIKWGAEGKDLKENTGVDTVFDCSHNLALAQRDGGIIDPALEHFLKGKTVAEITDPNEFERTQDGAYYGNVGRCLHLMGESDGAMICYRKSFIALQNEVKADHVLNQGYIRFWLGELLRRQDNFDLASAFFFAANEKWKLVSPVRHVLSEKAYLECSENSAVDFKSGSDAEIVIQAWI